MNKLRTVSAKAISDCRLNIISKEVLETLVSSNPLVALSMLKKLVIRLEGAYDQIEEHFGNKKDILYNSSSYPNFVRINIRRKVLSI